MKYDYIVRYMAYCLILLSLLSIFDWVNIPLLFITGYSITALLLVIVSLLEHKAEEKSDPLKFNRSKAIIYFFSVAFFMIFPFIKVDLSNEIIEKLGSVTVLISIGIILWISADKHNQLVNNQMDEIVKNYIQEQMNSSEMQKNIRTTAESVIQESNVSELTREAIEKFNNENKDISK